MNEVLFFLRRGRLLQQVTLAQASRLHQQRRDASGLGASEFPPMPIFDGAGRRAASVSYNGRVWLESGELALEAQPL
jgi:hypothetical protein